MNKIDVVICTKNRHELLAKVVNQVNLFSFNRLVIVDSSEIPFVLKGKGSVIHCPEAKLGRARQIGLESCGSKYVFFVDDDNDLTPSCLKILYDVLEKSKDRKLIAVSGNVIFGKGKTMRKLFSQTKPSGQGENGGFVLLNREEVLSIGGFNKKIHWGEDVELRQRMNDKGLKWGRVREAIAYHRCTFFQALRDMKRHGEGCRGAVIISGHSFRMSVRILGRIFIMPVVYGFQTCDPRVFGCYLLMNLNLLWGYCRGLR